jgi:hypothetical protein
METRSVSEGKVCPGSLRPVTFSFIEEKVATKNTKRHKKKSVFIVPLANKFYLYAS